MEEFISGASGGDGLLPTVRDQVEPVIGADLSHVRVHTDSTSASIASALQARAFTYRSNIFLAAGGSRADVSLLAHEATHVVQQGGAEPIRRPEPSVTAAASGVSASAPAMLSPAPATADTSRVAEDLTAPVGPVILDNIQIASYSDAAAAITMWSIRLEHEITETTSGGAMVPEQATRTLESGRQYISILGTDTEPIDAGNRMDIRAWHERYTAALNDCLAAQAIEAGLRARATAARLRALDAQFQSMLPAIRDTQRARFRALDEEGLLKTADTIATVLDTALITKEAVDAALDFEAEMGLFATSANASTSTLSLSDKIRLIGDVLEKINMVWAGFQSIRAGLDLMTGSRTDAEAGNKAVSAMATALSAGSTLLGGSAILTLYSNLYIGPLTSKCVELLGALQDKISVGSNRTMIEAGRFDLVDWSLEPGGREVFDYMLSVMRASVAADVPRPAGKVDDYFVDNADEFSAGVGRAGGEIPTEGWWLWKETDKSVIKYWMFHNRRHLWGMLYGAAAVPSGRPEF